MKTLGKMYTFVFILSAFSMIAKADGLGNCDSFYRSAALDKFQEMEADILQSLNATTDGQAFCHTLRAANAGDKGGVLVLFTHSLQYNPGATYQDHKTLAIAVQMQFEYSSAGNPIRLMDSFAHWIQQ